MHKETKEDLSFKTLTFNLTFCMRTPTPTLTRTPGYSNSSSALKCRRAKNVSANQRPGWPFSFSDRPEKNTNLVDDVEILLPVKFLLIPFSGFRGEVGNVSANQRPVRLFSFSDWPDKHKLNRGHWDLAFCQVSLNAVQRLQRRSRKCLSQSEARAAILFFRSAQKTQTW